jgi:hypothetical protein
MPCHATCYQIQRQGMGFTVLDATPAPNTKPCNSDANKAVAIKAAEDEVNKDEARGNEDVNNCAAEGGGCACPPWPVWPQGGWGNPTHAGLTAVKKITIPGAECVWTVILKYDRHERMRSANCR